MKIEYEPNLTELADGVYAINAPFEDVPNVVYVILSDNVTLVDSGVRQTPAEYILPALNTLGRTPRDIRLVLNTHGHHDHQGGNAALLDAATNAVVGCHPDDEGWLLSVPAYLQEMYKELAEYWTMDAQFEERIRRLIGEPIAATVPVRQGDALQLGDNHTVRAHHVPAHSPGHLVFEHEEGRLLFTGDALQGRGTPLAARPNFFPFYYSVEAYLASLDLFEDIDPTITGTAHHGLQDRAGMQALVDQSRELLAQVRQALADHLHRSSQVTLDSAIRHLSDQWPQFSLGSQIIRTAGAHMKELVAEGLATPGEQPATWEAVKE